MNPSMELGSAIHGSNTPSREGESAGLRLVLRALLLLHGVELTHLLAQAFKVTN